MNQLALFQKQLIGSNNFIDSVRLNPVKCSFMGGRPNIHFTSCHHFKYRVPRLNHRLPTHARANSRLPVFVLLPRTAPVAVCLSCSSTLRDETRDARLHHFIVKKERIESALIVFFHFDCLISELR